MTPPASIRLLVVDDHAMVREGLATFLLAYQDIQLVGQAASGEEAIRRFEELRPDVVLMDLMLPGVNGVDATRTILASHPDAKIIALTSYRDETLVPQALEAGARGFLLKHISADELVDAIRLVAAGKPAISPESMQALLSAALAPARPPARGQLGSDLTERERAVLALMSKGLNNNEIAEKLIVSPWTIKTHVSNILNKLGAATRTEAVALAIEHHLLA